MKNSVIDFNTGIGKDIGLIPNMNFISSFVMIHKCALVFQAAVFIALLNLQCVTSGSMPGEHFDNDTTTCEEFSRFARFNPYSILSDEWIAFYYWGPPQSPLIAIFFVPTTVQTNYLKFILDDHVLEPINWTAKLLVMRERDNSTYLLVEQSERGHYLLYEPRKGFAKKDIAEALDIRIKQTGDGKYFAMMDCRGDIVYVFARLKDIPKKDKLQDEAARIGYRGRGGKSYLYQGHQWMPIPEADDEMFEDAMKQRKERIYREP